MNRYKFDLPAKVYITRRVLVLAETEEEARLFLRDGDYDEIDHDEVGESKDFANEAKLLDVEEYEE